MRLLPIREVSMYCRRLVLLKRIEMMFLCIIDAISKPGLILRFGEDGTFLRCFDNYSILLTLTQQNFYFVAFASFEVKVRYDSLRNILLDRKRNPTFYEVGLILFGKADYKINSNYSSHQRNYS
jgi:hypothetical protein